MINRRTFLKHCALSAAAFACGSILTPLQKVSAAFESRIPVLLYHRVGDTGGALTVTPERFSWDLTRLKANGYQTISLEQFQNFLDNKGNSLPENPVLITFDDGYRDNYDNAYPILKKQDMKASFYIITSLVGADDRLNVAQIKEMAANGMSFGSHTVSHRSLETMDREEMQNELAISRSYLEGLLERQIRFVAYPKGSYNSDTIFAANEVGYQGAFSVLPGTCSKETNPFVLRRIPVFSFDGDVFRAIAKRSRG